ncbi:MAG TPA: PKD-like family lipoprotein [Niastella sp.]
MKRFSIIILTAFISFLCACYKDKGNYDYKAINEVTITGMAANYSAILDFDVLHIEPAIKMTEQTVDPDRFSYYWILYKSTTVIDTLGRAAILDYRINVNPDTYSLYLRVVDQETGVEWKKGTTLKVGTRYSTGLMLMGTGENGNAEVDMISMVTDTVVVRGILSNSGLPALQGPVTIVHNGNKDTSTKYGRVWVMTKSGSYYINRQKMLGTTSKNFGSIVDLTDPLNKQSLTPILYAPQLKDRAGGVGNTYSRVMMTSDGNVFPTSAFLAGGDFYQNPANREQGNFSKLFKAAPFLWYSINALNSFMWYDTENQRFMNYTAFGNTVSVVLADNAGDIFPWNQAAVGRTLVYGENTRNTDGGSTDGNSFAIMKDNSNNHYIYKFFASGATPQKRDMYTVKPIATDFDKASFYAFSSKRTVVFYAVGNVLHAYDYNMGLEKAYTFPEIVDEITMLKFDTQIDFATNALYIATYNAGTKGRLRRYMVGTDPNTITISPVNRSDWDGLIKIKDMNWRAVN